MAKKGSVYHPQQKTVQIPADIRALGDSGKPIAQAIRSHWHNMISEGQRLKNIKYY